MDFPIKNGDFPWQNVSSPEGISHSLPRLTRALWHRAWRRRRAFLYHPMLLPIVRFLLGVSGENYLALGRLCDVLGLGGAGCAGDGWGLHTRA